MDGFRAEFFEIETPNVVLARLVRATNFVSQKNRIACIKQAMTIMEAIQYQTMPGGDVEGRRIVSIRKMPKLLQFSYGARFCDKL